MHRTVLILALAVLLAPGCQQVSDVLAGLDKPSVRVRNVRLADLSLDSVTLGIDLDILNPYSVALPLLGVDYDLGSAGTRFLSGRSESSLLIPARGTSTYPFTARIPFAGLLQVLTSVRPGTAFPYDADLGLFVDAPVVGELRLPVSHSGEIPVPAVPDVSLAEIQWEELSMSRVAARLALDVTNTNSFPLDLNQLAYGLSLGGVRVGEAGVSNAASFTAGGAQRLSVPLSFSPMSAGMGLFHMLTGSGSSYELSGTILGSTPYGPIELPYSSAGNTSFRK